MRTRAFPVERRHLPNGKLLLICRSRQQRWSWSPPLMDSPILLFHLRPYVPRCSGVQFPLAEANVMPSLSPPLCTPALPGYSSVGWSQPLGIMYMGSRTCEYARENMAIFWLKIIRRSVLRWLAFHLLLRGVLTQREMFSRAPLLRKIKVSTFIFSWFSCIFEIFRYNGVVIWYYYYPTLFSIGGACWGQKPVFERIWRNYVKLRLPPPFFLLVGLVEDKNRFFERIWLNYVKLWNFVKNIFTC